MPRSAFNSRATSLQPLAPVRCPGSWPPSVPLASAAILSAAAVAVHRLPADEGQQVLSVPPGRSRSSRCRHRRAAGLPAASVPPRRCAGRGASAARRSPTVYESPPADRAPGRASRTLVLLGVEPGRVPDRHALEVRAVRVRIADARRSPAVPGLEQLVRLAGTTGAGRTRRSA